MPLLEGLTFSEAMEALYEAGFMFGYVTRRHDVEPVDTVVSQSLVPGTPVMTDVYIDLVLSLGGVQALVPDVKFASLEEAERMLLTARFVIDIVRVQDERVARDVVVNQYPLGNVPALQGSTVHNSDLSFLSNLC